MVVIRLSRSGAKKNPYYFITVADSRNARDGAFIERLGFYNPSAKGQEEILRIDVEKIDEWVSKGAQVSDRVKRLIKDSKLSPEELDARKAAKKDKADAKKAAALAAKQEEIKKQAEEAAEEAAPEEALAEEPDEEAAPEEADEEEVVDKPFQVEAADSGAVELLELFGEVLSEHVHVQPLERRRFRGFRRLRLRIRAVCERCLLLESVLHLFTKIQGAKTNSSK